MSDINERLDKLREYIQRSDFLESKGLSNEVNIQIFCYDPEDEMKAVHFQNQILTDQSLECHLIECDLYRVFLSICEDLDIVNSVCEMEAEDGSEYALEQLHSAIGEDEFIQKMQELVGKTKVGDVLLLTGVGNVFPFMRVHKMLEAMQPYFSDTPILVMYPGAFDGSALRLFNQLIPNSYYRAFNVL